MDRFRMGSDHELQPLPPSSNAPRADREVDGGAGAPKLPFSGDARTHAAWCSWLAALAEDAEAALAAALTYEGLSATDRLAWLDALDADAPQVPVPRVALYAPLLGVERDEDRRERIMLSMTPSAMASDGTSDEEAVTGSRTKPHALKPAHALLGQETCVLVLPLYLNFVELLVCRYTDDGIVSAHHEPLLNLRDVAKTCAKLGTTLAVVSLEEAVEALAHAVVADRRAGRAPNPDVVRFSRLFDASRR